MPQFAATIKHLKEGVKGFTISAAVKNIEGWETTLEKIEAPLHVSKVAHVVDGKPTRVRYEMQDGKKVRVAVKTGGRIDG